MPTLRHQDWLALQEAILLLNSEENLASLPRRVLAATGSVVPFDTATAQDNRGGAANVPWLEIEHDSWGRGEASFWRRGVRAMTDYELPFHPMREAFFACSNERHPHTDYFLRTGDGTTCRISDVIPMPRLQRTQFFNEISRPMRIKWQLTFYESLPQNGTLFLAACRKQTDFSDRDVAMFELLRPHVANAWRRMLTREALQSRWAELPLDDNGADDGLCRHFGLTAREAEVLGWVAQGKTNKEIGIILGRSVATVKTHLLRVFAKLGCETRTAAARTALEAVASGPI